MLQDKEIALDNLMACKTSVMDLTIAALESSNTQLKQVLLQMRTQAEQSHEEIYQIAERTGGYISAALADHQVVNRVSNFFSQDMTNQYQSGYGGGQYSTVSQGSYQNQGYGIGNRGRGYQSHESINPLNGQSKQYY